MSTMNDWLTEARFWSQVTGDAKRTVICPPDLESRCKGYVDARGLSGIIAVVANPECPADRLYVIDQQAIAAEFSKPRRVSLWPI